MNPALTEDDAEVLVSRHELLEHLAVDPLDAVADLHDVGVSQPVHHLLLVKVVPLVSNVLPVPEEAQAKGLPKSDELSKI